MNGGWMPRFDPAEVNFNYTEANAWQYSLFAPQDIGGLIDLHGGKAGLEAHLDALFAADSKTTGREQADITGLIGQYAHGNEPSHHMAYLYAYCGAAHKTQALVRRILDQLYTTQPDGLSGNEDCGQMSAWLVMSAMGFYPVTPGSPHYVLGSPWFPAVTLHLENGKQFRISSTANGPKAPFVQRADLNGHAWRKPWISHTDIMAGGELHFDMGTQPAPGWFTPEHEIPDLRILGNRPIAMPYVVAEAQTFTDSMVVEIRSAEPNRRFRVSFDHHTPAGPQSPVYQGPITLRADTKIMARAETPDGRMSLPTYASFYKIDGSRSIRLESEYANQYAAGGDHALIDRLRGGANFRTGRWQGYQEDLKGTLDLGKVSDVRKVQMGFLQDIGSWIWLPPEVEFFGSEDGKRFVSLGKVHSSVPDRETTALTRDYLLSNAGATWRLRYLRFEARNYGVCPPWHLGAGGRAWIFTDELIIE
jgi:hypothetical protein